MSVLAAQNLSLGVSEPLSSQKCYFQPCMSSFSALENTLVNACLHATFENAKRFVFSLPQTEPDSLAYYRNFQTGLNLEARENHTEICKREASTAAENVLLKLLVKAGLSDATRVPLYLQQNVKCDEDDANNRLITSLWTRQIPITRSVEEEEGRLPETDSSKARIGVMPLDSMNKMERGMSDSNWFLSAGRGKEEENHVPANDKSSVGGKDKRKTEEDDDDNEDDDSDEEDGGDNDDNDGSDDGEGEEESSQDDDDDEGNDDGEEDDDEYDEEVADQLAQQSKGVPANDEDDDEDEESGDGEGEEGVDGGESDEEEGEEEGVDEEEFEEENEDEGENDEEDDDEEEEEAQPPKKKLKGA